jgi:toxin ParE1/3/4
VKLRLSRSAAADLLAIWRYSERHWGARQADAYLDALGARFRWLADNPGLWPRAEGAGSGIYRFLQGRHATYFRADNAVLEIIRVLHQRMDPTIHLE